LDLLTPRLERQKEAEEIIQVLVDLLKIHPSPNVEDGKAWASDGPMTPAASSLLDEKSVTSALTESKTMVMKLVRNNVNILHGEIFSLIMVTYCHPPTERIAIYTQTISIPFAFYKIYAQT